MMKRVKTVIGCAVVGAVVFLSSNPALAGNLVRNGGFDEFDLREGKRGAVTNWNYFDGEYLDSQKEELGWQVTDGGTLEIRRDGVAGRAHDGSSHFMELDAHRYGGNVSADEDLGIFQDIVTQVGQKYRLSFSYAARPNIDGDRNQFEVKFGEVFEQQLDGGNGRTQDGKAWKTFSTEIVADSDLTRLQFNYLGRRDTLGGHLDSVSLEAIPQEQEVPEPTALLGLALFGMAGVKSVIKKK